MCAPSTRKSTGTAPLPDASAQVGRVGGRRWHSLRVIAWGWPRFCKYGLEILCATPGCNRAGSQLKNHIYTSKHVFGSQFLLRSPRLAQLQQPADTRGRGGGTLCRAREATLIAPAQKDIQSAFLQTQKSFPYAFQAFQRYHFWQRKHPFSFWSRR